MLLQEEAELLDVIREKGEACAEEDPGRRDWTYSNVDVTCSRRAVERLPYGHEERMIFYGRLNWNNITQVLFSTKLAA